MTSEIRQRVERAMHNVDHDFKLEWSGDTLFVIDLININSASIHFLQDGRVRIFDDRYKCSNTYASVEAFLKDYEGETK